MLTVIHFNNAHQQRIKKHKTNKDIVKWKTVYLAHFPLAAAVRSHREKLGGARINLTILNKKKIKNFSKLGSNKMHKKVE